MCKIDKQQVCVCVYVYIYIYIYIYIAQDIIAISL